jgi:hypothetical protein
MYIVLSAFTSSPASLLVATKASAFFLIVCTLRQYTHAETKASHNRFTSNCRNMRPHYANFIMPSSGP